MPFGKAALHDRLYNQGGHSIHNHFIIKSLRLVRPGGPLTAMVPGQYRPADQYLLGWSRDFITVLGG